MIDQPRRDEAALDAFAELFMRRVRDQALFEGFGTLSGHMKAAACRNLHERLRGLSPDQAAAVRDLITDTVDNALHHLLWTIEQEEALSVRMRTGSGYSDELRDLSDGLAGELDPWAKRFSRYPLFSL
jgi:hypothetical protein